MTATFDEHDLGGIRWLIARGPRDSVFRELGAHTRDDVATVLESMPEREALQGLVETPSGRARFAELVEVTRKHHPREARELDDLATGAGRDVDEVWLANLRGDLGGVDGTGCSDLGWRRQSSFVVHNEDGAPGLFGRFMLLTLAVEEEVPVTVQWYPGFLPANTFCATGNGLVWGINHVQVVAPARAPGRHFVARSLQHVSTLDGAVQHLESHGSAGGFAYTLGEVGSSRVVTVEAAAGRSATSEAGPPRRCLMWHTNHLLHIRGDVADVGAGAGPLSTEAAGKLGGLQESRERAKVLESVIPPVGEPDVEWFHRILREAPVPDGVHRDAAGNDPLLTLCTTVADLTNGEVVITPRGGSTTTLRLADFARGRASAVAP